MLTMIVNNEEYKIKFGYKAVAKSKIMTEAVALQNAMSSHSKAKAEKKKAIEEEKRQREIWAEHFIDAEPIEEDDTDISDYVTSLEELMDIVPKMVLAGLQRKKREIEKDEKYAEFKCDYSNEDDVAEKTELAIDFVDDYMEGENALDITDLFTTLLNELFENGFLSRKSPKLEEAMTEQNATITPTDHLQPQN